MISVIIPAFRNPKYCQLAIDALLHHQWETNEIIVVVDGYVEMYAHLIPQYPTVKWLWQDENVGLPMVTNIGVYHATSDRILIINEDNVMPTQWDKRLNQIYDSKHIIAVQQIEPEPSIFKFLIKDFGRTADTFHMQEFTAWESEQGCSVFTADAYTLPIFMAKRWFMAVGGWDVSYASPFVVDLDFFLKLQLVNGLRFSRYHGVACYHFGSRSTKKREDEESNGLNTWDEGERYAAMQFQYKWGVLPTRNNNNAISTADLRGIANAILPVS